MKKFTGLLVFLFSLSFGLKAQSLYWSDITPARCFFGNNKLTLDQIKGSPYLAPEYVKGTVITSDGKSFSDVPLRYNCYDDILEFKSDGKSYEIYPKEKVDRAEFGGQVFSYLQHEPRSGVRKSYFQILTEGKAILCVNYQISFFEKEEALGYGTPKPARFDNLLTTYWISINNSPAKEIVNKHKLLEILSDRQKEIKDYLSNQDLSIKKVDDLKKIVNYYNTLK